MWDIRYRPLTFGDVLGQEGAVLLLKARLSKGTALDTSYVFAGGHGQGKTTLARILARAMLCQNLSKTDPEPCNECENCKDILAETSTAYVEQDAASRGTIEHVRAIVDDLPFVVLNAPKRVYVFDEAHRMSRDAQDVLLKPLEDKKMVGVFCTTEPEKIRGPIRSRCEEYLIRKITREDVLVRMKKILDKEGVAHEDDAVLTVIDYSGGHVRDVLNKLEMIAQAGEVTVASVREYLHLNIVSTYYEILLSLADSKKAIELIEMATSRVSPEEVAAGLAEAAMNSFRLANGMFTEFVYVDRALAQKLWALYGVSCVRLAEWFLRAKYATKVSLICDVLHFVKGVPAGPTPPVVFHIAASVGMAPMALPPDQTSVEVVPVVSSPLPVVAAPVATPPPVSPPIPGSAPTAKAVDPVVRPHVVGNLGSSDVQALTTLDTKVIGEEKARGRNHQTPPVILPPLDASQGDEFKILLPEEWRQEFARTWLRRG